METAVQSQDIDLSQFTGHPIELDSFHGPLDFLLHLIKKDQVEIWDISVSRITRQYLGYISELQKLNIEVAGDFLVMAATLMRMKSQMLLPRPSFLAEDDPDGAPLTREGLIARLLEYRRLKEVALSLREMESREIRRYPRGAISRLERGYLYPLREPRLFDLVEYFQDVLNRSERSGGHAVYLEEFKLEDQMEWIQSAIDDDGYRERLPDGQRMGIRFSRLLRKKDSRMETVVTLLAVLELGKLQALTTEQLESFAEVWLLASVDSTTHPETKPEMGIA